MNDDLNAIYQVLWLHIHSRSIHPQWFVRKGLIPMVYVYLLHHIAYQWSKDIFRSIMLHVRGYILLGNNNFSSQFLVLLILSVVVRPNPNQIQNRRDHLWRYQFVNNPNHRLTQRLCWEISKYLFSMMMSYCWW